MWARIQYDRWNEEVERQKSKTEEVVEIPENEEMKSKEEQTPVTESEVAKEREALREDYEALFIVAKNTFWEIKIECNVISTKYIYSF